MGATLSSAANSVPTDNPYVSQGGRLYVPAGNLSGAILPGNFDNLWLSGAGALAPMSNNFTDAVRKCTAMCDTDPKCLSFNVFMVHEDDFNNGAPTWECRFSGNIYSAQDYTSNNGLDSFAWSVEAVPETANNVPTDNPFMSKAGRFYYPAGNLNGAILPGNFDNLWLFGAGQAYPMSNNFSDALEKCTAICDTDSKCLSFNAFMVHEDDFNNGSPTWECRFSGNIYSAQDYTSNNGLDSFAWSVGVAPEKANSMPTDNPYVSEAGRPFYPMGNQNGHILGGNYKSLWLSGAGQPYPMSNNFTDALKRCLAEYDTDYTCLSFNIFMVHEDNFNSGAPAWECRFSGNLYSTQDYQSDNGLDSFAWSMKIIDTQPSCTAHDNDDHNPQAWKDAGMDAWLWGFAVQNNLIGVTDHFADKLMNALNWTYYTCDTDPTTCSYDTNTVVSECVNWINIQIATYRKYLAGLGPVLTQIESSFQIVGDDIFQNLWWTGSYSVPKTNQMSPATLIKDIGLSAAGLLPVAGVYIQKFGTLIVDATMIPSTGDANNNPQAPDPAKFWSSIMTTYDQQFSALGETITKVSGQTMQSPELLGDVLAGGSWFIPNPSLPDPLEAWSEMVPYYASKIGMQAMAVQQAFFVAVPMTFATPWGGDLIYPEGTPCTQDIADQFGEAFDLYSSYTKGTAFCDTDDNQVIVPLIGFTPSPVVFTNYGNVSTHIQSIIDGYGNPKGFKLDNQAIYRSSMSCKNAQPHVNGNMTLYFSEPLLSAGLGAGDAAGADCVWSIPVFQWNEWFWQMYKDCDDQAVLTGMDDRGWVHDYVSYLAYQLRFLDKIHWYYWKNSDGYSGEWLQPPSRLTFVNSTDSAAISSTGVWGV